MEFTNYILEAAGVSDVDIMDIEVTQAMAEMAVLEAMMDCYEKQMVLLEYNEDSADEIFTEAETFVPAMPEEYVVEFKKINVQRDGATGKWQVVQYEAENEKIKDDKGWTHTSAVRKYGVNTPGVEPDKILGTYDTEKEAQDAYEKFNLDLFGKQSKTRIEREKRAQLPHEKTPRGTFDARKENPERTERKLAERKKKLEKAAGTPATPGSNATTPSESPKQADQWDGSANVSTASKSFGNSFKKFMSKAGSVIQQLVLGLVDAVFSVNFDKLADKIAEKGAGFTMNDKQFQTINRLEDLMDLTQQYYGKFDSTLLSRVNWTRAEVNKYKNILSETSAALKQKYVDTGVFNNTAEQVNSPNKQTTPEDLIDLCHALGKNDFKKLLRKCQKEAAAYNTDFNENANIPPEIGKAMRTFVNDLIKVYNKTTKDFKGMLNWALEVGAAQSHREKNGGIDQSPVGFKKSPKAKELQEQRKAYRKSLRDSKKQESWAEEGWSMNLSEDEDFF